MNAFDQVTQALDEAKAMQNAADNCAARMARMLRGRLKHCCNGDLVALKKELRNFNIQTGKWSDGK